MAKRAWATAGDDDPDETPLEDGTTFGATPTPWRVWRFLARLCFAHPILLTLSLLASVGVALAGIVSLALIFPFVESLAGVEMPADFALGFFTPYFEGMSTVDKVRVIAFLLLGIQVFRGVLSYTESRLTQYMRILIEQDLRQVVFDDLLRVELRWLQKERLSNLFNVMHTYPKMTSTLIDQYLSALTKGVQGVSYFILLLAVSWQLTLIATGLALASLLVINRLNRIVKALTRRINASRVRLHQTSFETLQAMRLIRVFARERHAHGRFMDDVRAMRRQSFRRASITSAMPQLHAILNMAMFAGLIFAATLVLDPTDGFWLIQLTTFILVMSRLITPIVAMTRKRAQIIENIPAAEEVLTFLELDKPTLKNGSRRFEKLREGVRFEGVSFSYDDGTRILDDVTLEVRRGTKVALVGPSGSGKSTLLMLLSRLSDPAAGRVVVDGVDLRDYESGTWRSRVAVVSQDTFLFNDTVRNNILFGRPDASPEDVERAAKLANAHAFILEMEDGYETIVGDRGTRLSGGQAQRIAIARAILADPEVLVLDEATSALDAGTERLVQDALDRASRDRTVIAVAHRLATVRDADCIYVLAKGRVVQAGRHDELLAQPGMYKRLVGMQDLGATAGARQPSPLRVVFNPSRPTARLANGEVVGEDVAIVMAAGREAAEREAADAKRPVVVVWPGATVAFVRVADGAPVQQAPLFEERQGSAERRVRIGAAVPAA